MGMRVEQAVLQGSSAAAVGGMGRHHQPAGLREGLRRAQVGLRSGFSSAAEAILVRPARSLQRDGIATALGVPPQRLLKRQKSAPVSGIEHDAAVRKCYCSPYSRWLCQV